MPAITLKKPRWLLAHDHVIFARQLLNNLGYKGKAGRKGLNLVKKTAILEVTTNMATWAHEMYHVEQYRNWFFFGFAKR